jgi:hypothetical protein
LDEKHPRKKSNGAENETSSKERIRNDDTSGDAGNDTDGIGGAENETSSQERIRNDDTSGDAGNDGIGGAENETSSQERIRNDDTSGDAGNEGFGIKEITICATAMICVLVIAAVVGVVIRKCMHTVSAVTVDVESNLKFSAHASGTPFIRAKQICDNATNEEATMEYHSQNNLLVVDETSQQTLSALQHSLKSYDSFELGVNERR